jgi:hypothetical protein
MGLLVSVYRSGLGDCTNKGISSNTTDLCVVNMEGPWKPEDSRYPAAILTKNGLGGPCFKPAVQNESGEWVVAPGWWMNGGNIAATSDSRFGEAVRKMFPGCADFHGGVYIHDRKE